MIYFLVNGDQTIGSGHFRRCVAIARELEKMGQGVAFLSWSMDEEFCAQLRQLQWDFHVDEDKRLRWLPGYLTNGSASLLIIDSDDLQVYREELQLKLRKAGIRLMFITVQDEPHYHADIVLNQSVLGLHQHYRTENHTRLLLGPRYFIFGEDFRRKEIEPVRALGRNIFIGFGGADPMNYTSLLLEGFAASGEFSGYRFLTVVGALNSHWSQVQRLSSECDLDVELYHDLQDMRSVYARSDLAICSAGTMFWELCLFGVRSLMLASSPREMESAVLFDELGYTTLVHRYGDRFSFSNVSGKLTSSPVAPNLHELQHQIDPDGVRNVCSEIQSLLGN